MNEMEAHRVAYTTWEACSHESEVSGEVCLNCIAKTILAERTLAQQEARAAALEEAARMAETWGNAPPNPHGRRAALAAGIRALLEGK